MVGLNKVMLIGNVGHDPEIKRINDTKELATFKMATTETWRDRQTGEKKEETQWHKIVIFSDGLIEIVRNFVKKGTKLFFIDKMALFFGTVTSSKFINSTSCIHNFLLASIKRMTGRTNFDAQIFL